MSFDNKKVSVDQIIERLIKGLQLPPGRLIDVTETEMRYLCQTAREKFLSQPVLLELESPVKIFSDIHGQFYDLLRIFQMCGFPPESNYLFLGDSVDRGKQSLETICLLLCYKIKYPEKFFMLRGNHESASISRIYGFYDECKRRHNIRLWKTFMDCFNCLPVAAIVENQIFCCHGGLSPNISSMDDIRRIKRPTDVPEEGLLCDLLWSDPGEATNPKKPGPTVEAFVPKNSEQNGGTLNRHANVVTSSLLMRGYGFNYRGVSYTFNEVAVDRFLADHKLKLVCRGHEVVEDGYEFFSRRKLVTIFSAPNYCGEFENAGAVMNVDDTLLCSFKILKPLNKMRLATPAQVASSSTSATRQHSKKVANKAK